MKFSPDWDKSIIALPAKPGLEANASFFRKLGLILTELHGERSNKMCKFVEVFFHEYRNKFTQEQAESAFSALLNSGLIREFQAEVKETVSYQYVGMKQVSFMQKVSKTYVGLTKKGWNAFLADRQRHGY